ncbi:MAG TPA: substrate-binding domain-containing protein [Clostridia bacterium]|nr:substrate-binding domain-containing protein [Clostridia bacterium]
MFKKIFIGVLIMIILLISASCQDSDVIDETQENQKIKIGFSMDTLKEERWQKDRDIFVAEAEKLGAEVLVLAANGDDQKQIDHAQYLLDEGADILVIVPHDAEIASKIVEMAHAQDVKVISYDRLVYGDVDYYISFDNEKVGEIQSNYLINTLDFESGNVVYIGGAPTDNNASLLRKGALSVLSSKRDINVIYDEYTKDWEPKEAAKHMENVIDQYEDDFGAVICANDTLAKAVIAILAENQIQAYIIGQDAEISAAQRIVEGKQDMTVYKDIRSLATKAAEMSVDVVNGKTIETSKLVKNDVKNVPSILLEPVAVDATNMMALIINSGFHKYEDVYRNIPVDERPEN